MYFYNDWALRLIHGQGMGAEPLAFYGLPGYAWLLALLYRVFGYSPFIPALCQTLLDAGTAVLIYLLTLRVWPGGATEEGEPRRISARLVFALTAALGWVFFVPAATYSIILMPASWLIFVFWLVVWLVVRTDHAPSVVQSLFFGLLIGLTATGVATILFLVPLVLAALFLKRETQTSRRWGVRIFATACLFAGLAAGTAPCWTHNYFVAHDRVTLSAHSGINFWIGNNPDAKGYPSFPPGLRAGQAAMLEDSIHAAETAAGHPLKRGEVSAFWSAKAKQYIKEHPGDWLRLMMVKLRNFWSAFQYDDLSIVTALREQWVTLPGIYFGIVVAFGLPGLLLGCVKVPRSRWVAAAVLLHMTSLMTVFITERYRMAAVPGLLVFAGLTLFWLCQSIARGHCRQFGTVVILLAAAVALTSWPQRNPSLWALDSYNSGWQALESGNLGLAERKLETAWEYVPNNSETNFALGNLRLAQNRLDEAKARYMTTLSLDHQHKGALNNLGIVAGREHDWRWAENYFRGALNIDRLDAKTHFLLAEALLEQGRKNEALPEIETALQLRPGQREFLDLRERIEGTATP